MTFKELEIKRAYSSDEDNVLMEFYIPVLSKAIEYNRLAGFFSSSILAVAAKGITEFIENQGKMRLLVSPRFTLDEVNSILNAKDQFTYIIQDNMIKDLENLENMFLRDHIRALGWMIANDFLDIKVGAVQSKEGNLLPYKEANLTGIFHQKIGILKDTEENFLSFSGSINETAKGWTDNIEQFKVYSNWIEKERYYFMNDSETFNRFWNNQSSRVRTIDVPDAIENRLIEIAPRNIQDIDLRKWYPKAPIKSRVSLYNHQQAAVKQWLNNNRLGIFEMATGTGKTITALECVRLFFNDTVKSVCIISCPYHHLVEQWQKEIEKFNFNTEIIIADSTNRKWKNQLADLLINIHLGHEENAIVITTHSTLTRTDFSNILEKNLSPNMNSFLIGDEVHGIGSEKRRHNLSELIKLRLGLSATPARYFDDLGTQILFDFFGGVIFGFSLKDAIQKINPRTKQSYLTPFNYYASFVELTDEEMESYITSTKKIEKASGFLKDDDYDGQKKFEYLLFQRANILKNASEKYEALEKVLDKIVNETDKVKWILIYCSPEQIERVISIVSRKGLITARFTMHERTKTEARFGGRSEREYILDKFEEGEYQALVAIKCLDEGVDIPPANKAIFLSSSGNPREYIQRIGRVVRRYPGKNLSNIYDVIVAPPLKKLPQELKYIEEKIFEKELMRYEEIIKYSSNSSEALDVLYKIKSMIKEK